MGYFVSARLILHGDYSSGSLRRALLYLDRVFDIYPLLRPLLFTLPPETAHAVALGGLRLAHNVGLLNGIAHSLPFSAMGLTFPNRLGIAAGLDKNATCIDALGALGPGFIEVGTVTPRPQSGNRPPRLFRLREERALINRMGFPNDGVHAVVARLRARRYAGICGVNIGKNAETPVTHAVNDYVACLASVHTVADYVAVNISSPNTSELRRLQHGDLLRSLLTSLLEARSRIGGRRVPILVKLTADLDEVELRDAANIAVACGVEGIIASNTTVRRDGLSSVTRSEEGGLSGAPLAARALRAVQCICAEVGTKMTVIGVGGIDNIDSARAMRVAGADLIQIYTALIYRGPMLLRELVASDAIA